MRYGLARGEGSDEVKERETKTVALLGRDRFVGVAYEGQELEKVPVGPYDMPLNAMLFPGSLLELQESSKQ